MDKISIVVPCYNEDSVIPIFYKEIIKSFEQIKVNYEIIFVDDGSKDNSLLEMKKITNEKIKYISFSRNFGKEAAMLAGLKEANGDYIAIMDVDLQDPPSLIKEMYETLKTTDYDIVATRRVTRKGEPRIRSFFARMFYKIINSMSNVEMVDGARDFRLMKRRVVDSILSLSEYNRYSKGIFCFVGYKTKWLEYENINRVAGTTKWSFISLFKYAIEGILAFSNTLLIIPLYIGILGLIASIVLLIILLTNFSNLMLIILIVIGIFSILSIMIGVLGLYISKIVMEVRDRPNYIIREKSK